MLQVKQEEYDAFFKATFKEFLEPLAHSHFNVEGIFASAMNSTYFVPAHGQHHLCCFDKHVSSDCFVDFSPLPLQCGECH